MQSNLFVAVFAFVLLAFAQQSQQGCVFRLILQFVNLVLVMLVDKGFNRCNGGVHGARAKQCGQGAGGKTCHPPAWQQAAALRPCQYGVDFVKVALLSFQMALGKFAYACVARQASRPR